MGSWKKASVGRSVILRPIKIFFVCFFFSVFFFFFGKIILFLSQHCSEWNCTFTTSSPLFAARCWPPALEQWRFPLETVRSFTIRRSEDMPVELQNDAGRVQRSLQEAMQRGMRSSFPPQLSPRDVHQYIFLLPFTSVYKPNALQRQLLEGDLEPTIR